MADEEKQVSAGNISCKWTGCSSLFNSELDMGLHVISNHLQVLNYGYFVLNRSSENSTGQKVEATKTMGNSQQSANDEQAMKVHPVQSSPQDTLVATSSSNNHQRVLRKRGSDNNVANQLDSSPTRYTLYLTPSPPMPNQKSLQKQNHVSPSARTRHATRSSQNQDSGNQKSSKLCQGLINRLQARSTSFFRTSTNYEFCLNCLSFKMCSTVHNNVEEGVEQYWKSKYGEQKKINSNGLLEQLEEMKSDYINLGD